MKIIILGAGRVGASVADSLVSERNDITVIDQDPARLRELESRYDLRGVVGNGIDPRVLAEAGANDTDLLIACAAQDETNLVCCKVAQVMFNVPKLVARVRSSGLDKSDKLLGKDGFGVDRIICPEESLTRYIGKLIEFPEAMQVREFAGGRACLVSVRARGGAPMVGHRIGALRLMAPDVAMRIVGIYRRFAEEPDRFISCDGSTMVEPGDEVFVLSGREQISEVLSSFHRPSGQNARPVRRIMMAGGGRVALRLARQLTRQGSHHIKIIEMSPERCVALASELPSDVLVLQGDATDEELLGNESIEDVDLFLAITGDDEDNIMASLLAKRMGASRVLALINRRSYADLMHGTQIDIALSPAQAMLGELLAYVRQGDVQAVHSLRRGVAEALEIVARGDAKSSRVVGRKISDIHLPPEVTMGLIVRGLPDPTEPQEEGSEPKQREVQVIVPRSHTVIESNDHVVFFLPNKRLVKDVEKLFRVSATYF
ncbi:Trk system potassium transporter TrkA [Diaphorobacter ruginosibacter]|uniref:Trk system potassium uptake protein TrkA n=1 Tax=Diaphorobacter ruginosibacter TaxID=1715720 RepID=A0A7G9RNH3_9BURK|nr:Trk system potassium transporter TrkA [Diaphorobacter ruginosibacter]QNN57148.1 Trk system potassium transporter TrkA [Diaphorobacter ruginosibacter]